MAIKREREQCSGARCVIGFSEKTGTPTADQHRDIRCAQAQFANYWNINSISVRRDEKWSLVRLSCLRRRRFFKGQTWSSYVKRFHINFSFWIPRLSKSPEKVSFPSSFTAAFSQVASILSDTHPTSPTLKHEKPAHLWIGSFPRRATAGDKK